MRARRQAKFYLSEDAIGRLRQESERTTHSMSTIVNLLVARYLPEVSAEPPAAPAAAASCVVPEPENTKQDHEQEPSYDDVDFDF